MAAAGAPPDSRAAANERTGTRRRRPIRGAHFKSPSLSFPVSPADSAARTACLATTTPTSSSHSSHSLSLRVRRRRATPEEEGERRERERERLKKVCVKTKSCSSDKEVPQVVVRCSCARTLHPEAVRAFPTRSPDDPRLRQDREVSQWEGGGRKGSRQSI